MSSPPKPITQTTFFSKSKQIVNANYAHFLSLSYLFFFPFFISLTSLLSFTISKSNPISLTPQSILLSFLYALLVLSLYVTAIATTTYSTQQALHGKPLNISSTIISLSKSFLPLASTTLASTAILLLDSILFLLSSASFLKILGYTSTFSTSFLFIASAVIITIFLISFHVILTIAAVISVVESKWWFGPLRLSFSLVKGMKRSSSSILLLHGISIWVIVLGISTQIYTTVEPQSYVQISQILTVSMFWTMLMTPLVNSYTVLYLVCKDLHEESGFDIEVEISKECVSLAIDDKKLVSESNVRILVFLAALMVPCGTLVVWLKN